MLIGIGILLILVGVGEALYGIWGIYMYYENHEDPLYNMHWMWISIGILMIAFGIFFATGFGGLI